MWNHVNMKRDLRPNDMCGSGDFDSILTFVGPQILDTLKISNESHAGIHLRLKELKRCWGHSSDYPYMLKCQIYSPAKLYLSACVVLIDETGSFDNCFHFVDNRATW